MRHNMHNALRKIVAVAIVPATLFAGLALGQSTAMADETSKCVVGQSTIAQCFPDPVLAKAVGGTATNSTFTSHYVKYTRELNLYNHVTVNVGGVNKVMNLKSIKGIENLPNLSALRIYSTDLTDLSPLKALKAVNDKRRASLPPRFANIPDLDTLEIWDNPGIKDYSPLKDLRIGSELILEHDDISDISFMPTKWGGRGGPYACRLDLKNNQISDVTPLSHLTMAYVELDSNWISDVTPLGTMQIMKLLSISHNYVNDLSPLLKNSGHYYLIAKDETIASVQSSSDTISVPVAKNLNGSFVSPTRIRPSSGSYDPKTGMVTWPHLSNVGEASFSFHTNRIDTCGTLCNIFSGTISVIIGGVPEAESLDPTPNSILRSFNPPTPITPPKKPRPPVVNPPIVPGPDLDPGTDPASNPLAYRTVQSGGKTKRLIYRYGPNTAQPQSNMAQSSAAQPQSNMAQSSAAQPQSNAAQPQSNTAQPIAAKTTMAKTGAAVTSIVLVAFTTLTLGVYIVLAKKRREQQ